MKTIARSTAAVWLAWGCASTGNEPVYPEARSLLSASVDLTTSISGRVPGFEIIVSSNPSVPGKRPGRAKVTDLLGSADGRATITVFATESGAASHFDWDCRGMEAYTSAAHLRIVSVADGGSCAMPYTMIRNDAHGLWAPLGYHAAIVVRRGRLVVSARQTRDEVPTVSEDELTSIVDKIAAAISE